MYVVCLCVFELCVCCHSNAFETAVLAYSVPPKSVHLVKRSAVATYRVKTKHYKKLQTSFLNYRKQTKNFT